ncbi:MAG: HPr family phosphocarrier protein [Eubacteriales bacterium]
MSKIKIVFDSIEEIGAFVNIVKKYPFEMDLSRGRLVVDAKSLLGIINLGIKKEVDLLVHADDCADLQAEILGFMTA